MIYTFLLDRSKVQETKLPTSWLRGRQERYDSFPRSPRRCLWDLAAPENNLFPLQEVISTPGAQSQAEGSVNAQLIKLAPDRASVTHKENVLDSSQWDSKPHAFLRKSGLGG